MTEKEFQNKYSPEFDEIIINGVTISYDCYEINVEDGKDVVCFYNEGGYCFMCSIPLEDVDLINRQQAKIEDYRRNIKQLTETLTGGNGLRIRVDNMIVYADDLEEWLEFCDKQKAEAIKELEAKIHEKLHEAEMHENFEPVVTREMFDSVVKELAGEGK